MAKRIRAYTVIWERVRANPDKGVPVDILDGFVTRVIKAVKNEKYFDSVYRAERAHAGKTGLMYVTRAIHPTNAKLVRVTFLLREFATLSEGDSYYLRKYPPGMNLVELLQLETIDPIAFADCKQVVGGKWFTLTDPTKETNHANE